MKGVLCYGDSNTWGAVPQSDTARYGPDVRWPRTLAATLGPEYDVHEAGLGSRTTVFEMLPLALRSGRDLLVPTLETNAPLDVVVILLGTNDVSLPHLSVSDIVRGAGELVTIVRSCWDLGPSPGQPPVPLLVGPHIVGPLTPEEEMRSPGAVQKSRELGAAYHDWARLAQCDFVDLADVVAPSAVDPWHWEPEGHEAAAGAIAPVVRAVVERG